MLKTKVTEIGNRQDMLPDGATISNHADKK